MTLEVVLLVPVMMLLALFVLWAGRGGRAALLSDLAAEEAAVAAALCCLEDDPELPANVEGREAVAEDVLYARPGLGLLCVGGPRPQAGNDGDEGFVSETWMEFPDGVEASGVGLLGVHFSCETDGAVAPVRAIFPTVVFEGQSVEVVVLEPSPAVTIDDVQADEGDDLVVTVSLNATSTETVQLEYFTVWESPPGERTATPLAEGPSGNDYYADLLGIVEIPAGELEASIVIRTVEDARYENAEVFDVVFTVLVLDGETEPPAVLTDDTIVATILNDDDPPVISFESLELRGVEGEPISLTAQLNARSGLPASVAVSLIDGTATNGTDFDPPSLTEDGLSLTEIVFDPGTTVFPFAVATIDDQIGEGDENFTIRLSYPQDATLDPLNGSLINGNLRVLDAVGTIVDNEPRMSIERSCDDTRFGGAAACALEGDVMEFEVSLSRPLTSEDLPVTVNVKTVQIGSDRLPQDDDGPLSLPARQGTASDMTADYVGVVSQQLTFSPPAIAGEDGDQTRVVSVQTKSDLLHEGESEVFQLELELDTWSENVLVENRFGLGAIIDDDDAPELTLSGPENAVLEGYPLAFVLRLDAPSGREVWLDYYTADDAEADNPAVGGAACGLNMVDFVSVPMAQATRVVFPVDMTTGQTEESVTVYVPSCNDQFDEADTETFNLVVANLLGAGLVGDVDTLSAAGRITDDDEAVIWVNSASALEPSGEESIVEFVVGLSAGSQREVQVQFETRQGALDDEKAAADGIDYEYADLEARSESLIFAAGEREKTVRVSVIDDELDEYNETFDLVLFNPVNAVFNPVNADLVNGELELSVEGTIVDNDGFPRLQLRGDLANEGQLLEFEAKLGVPSGRTVWFDYATVDDTATGGDDYEPKSGTLGIAPGSTLVVIDVVTLTDDVYEPDETLRVVLTSRPVPGIDPTYATLVAGRSEAIGTITDLTGAPELSITYPEDANGDPLLTAEGEDMIFTLELSNESAEDITVRFETADGTARAPADYTSYSGRLTIPAGEPSIQMSVMTEADGLDELVDIETMMASISLEEGSATIVKDAAYGAILDANEWTSSVWLSLDLLDGESYLVDEGETTATSRSSINVGELNGLRVVLSAPGPAPDYDPVPLPRPLAHDVTFNFYTRSPFMAFAATGGALGEVGADYLAVPSTDPWRVTIPSGVLSTVIDLPTFEDEVDEAAERFLVYVRSPNPSTFRLLRPTAVVDIVDDDPVPRVSVTAPEPVSEAADDPIIDFTVSLDRPSAHQLVVDYLVSGITATQDVDYQLSSPSGTVIFAPGEVEHTVSVEVIDDQVPEDEETLQLALSRPRPEGLLEEGTTAAEATIIDDDLGVSLEPAEVRGQEGQEGQDLEFTVRLNQPAPEALTVEYYTFAVSGDDAATPGDDFVAVAVADGQVQIAAGDDTATVTVQVLDDDMHEGEERFQLRLLTPQSYPDLIVDGGIATGVIEDDEPVPQLSVTGPTNGVPEGDQAQFTLSLDVTSSRQITVDYETVDGDAKAETDYVSLSDPAVFQPGERELAVPVDTRPDSLPEQDETFELVLSNAGPADAVTLGTARAEATIIDDDLGVRLDPAEVRGQEGQDLEFTVRLSQPAPEALTVEYYTFAVSGDDAATPGDDFVAVADGQVQIAAGDDTATVTVQIVDDDMHEGEERFQLRLATPQTNPDLIVDGETATGVIEDNEPVPQLSVTGPPSGVPEGEQAQFTLSLDVTSSQQITVDYTTAPGTAQTPADYSTQSASVTFAPGRKTFEVGVSTVDDVLPEQDEAFELVLSNASPGDAVTLDTARAEATIIDRDVSVGFITSPVSVVEGAGLAEFIVQMDKATSVDLMVDYFTRDIANGATGGTDYDPVPEQMPQTLTILGGSRAGVVSIPITDDFTDEDNEQFLVMLTNPRLTNPPPDVSVTMDPRSATGIIEDDDGPPEVSISGPDQFVEEGDVMEFTVSIEGSSEQPIEVGYGVVGGTAATPDDYVAVPSGTLTFAPGDTMQKSVTVTTTDDADEESSETVEMGLTSVNSAGALGTSAAVGVIADNDGCTRVGEPTPGLIYSPAVTVTEDAAAVTFAFALLKVFCFDTLASVRTVAGTAESGADFIGVNRDVSIAAGDDAFEVSVVITEDGLPEIAEQFTLEVSYDGETWAEVAITIVDNDQPDVAVSDATGKEGDDLTFAVTLSEPAPTTVTVGYRTVDIAGGATGGSAGQPGVDYEAQSGTLTLLPGQRSQNVTVPTFIDAVNDPLEQFELRLENAVNARIDAANGTGTGSILESACIRHLDDQEPLITFSVENLITVDENVSGSAGLVPVTFNNKPCSGSVFYTVQAAANGTAVGTPDTVFTPGDDFRLINTTGSLSWSRPDNTRWEYPASGIHNDTEPEYNDESFLVQIAWDETRMPSHYHDVQPVFSEVKIADDDRVIVSVGDASNFEGFDLEFEITLSEPIDFDITVGYATAHNASGVAPANGGDIAGEDQDYTPVSGSVTILAGETSASVFVRAIWDNNRNEEHETFLFKLSVDPRVSVGIGTAVGTIVNVYDCISREDISTLGLPVVLSPGLTRAPRLILHEDYGQGSHTYQIRARLCSNLTTETFIIPGPDGEINVGTQRQSLSGLEDYYENHPRKDLVYTSGWSSTTRHEWTPNLVRGPHYMVSVHDDSIYEGDEKGYMVIFVHGGPRQAFPLLIIDNDPPPPVSVHDLEIVEGDSSTFTVSLSTGSAFDTVVTFETRAHTSGGLPAVAGTDYTAVSGSVTIPAYEMSATFEIETLADSVEEGDETFVIKLTGATDATLLDDEGIVTILDDETCVTPTNPVDGPLNLSIEPTAVDESAGVVEITIRHTRVCEATDAIQFGTVATTSDTIPPEGETATPGPDYGARGPATLDVRGAEYESTFQIVVAGDRGYEGDETFTVWAQWGSGLPAAYGSLNRVTATVTILDDDPLPVVNIEDASSEFGQDLAFTIRLEHPDGGVVENALPVTVHWETRPLSSDDAAVSGTHFTAVTAGMTTISAGQTQGTATVRTFIVPGETAGFARLQAAITGVENASPADVLAAGLIYGCVDPATGPIPDVSPARVTLNESDGRVLTHLETEVPFCTDAPLYYSLIIDDSDGAVAADAADVSSLGSRESASEFSALFLAGSLTSSVLEINVLDDGEREPDETFILSYRWATGIMPDRYTSLEPAEVIITIVDDD